MMFKLKKDQHHIFNFHVNRIKKHYIEKRSHKIISVNNINGVLRRRM